MPTFKQFLERVNPDYLKGLNHGYHLDHIVPIIECFKRGWSAEKAANISNLQMLYWTENLSKGSK